MKSKIISFIIMITPILTGCLNNDFNPDKWALEPELTLSKSTIIFNSANGVDSVTVFTNYKIFEASSSADWCKITIDKKKFSLLIMVDPNIDTGQRNAIINVSIARGNKTLSKNLSIVQMGGVWETIGDFSVYWGYDVSTSQKKAIDELLTNMVYVNGGNFVMGNTNVISDAAHPHSVTLSGFYIGKYEITQKQWRAIMGSNPSDSKDENKPIYNISWAEALEFTTRLSKLTHLNVNLPTEAQWEFASKGGNSCKGYIYSGDDDYTHVAVFNSTTHSQEPAIVGSLNPNEIGIYDMSGNVAEYCMDWYEPNYGIDNDTNPTGPATGLSKCVRGGHINCTTTSYLRNTNRFQRSNRLDQVTPYTGLRIMIYDDND